MKWVLVVYYIASCMLYALMGLCPNPAVDIATGALFVGLLSLWEWQMRASQSRS